MVTVSRYRAVATPEAFVRVLSRMSPAESDKLGERMRETGLTGRELVAAVAARAGRWADFTLEALP